MKTKKVTISVAPAELAWIEQRARREHDGNVSAAFADGVHALRRQEALGDFLRMSNAPSLSAHEAAAVLAEIRGPVAGVAKPKRRTRSRRAA